MFPEMRRKYVAFEKKLHEMLCLQILRLKSSRARGLWHLCGQLVWRCSRAFRNKGWEGGIFFSIFLLIKKSISQFCDLSRKDGVLSKTPFSAAERRRALSSAAGTWPRFQADPRQPRFCLQSRSSFRKQTEPLPPGRLLESWGWLLRGSVGLGL